MIKKYRIITGPEAIQGSPEWLEFRKDKIGASDVASILGISPWETKLQCFDRFILGTQKEKTPQMERGTRLEPIALKWLNDKIGTNYKPVVLQSINHPNIIASLDGYYEDEEGKPHILEIKCAGHKAHQMALDGKVPEYYLPQLMHQMDLTGVNEMLYVSFDGEDGMVLLVERDEEYCIKIFTEILSFTASLLRFKPPTADDKDWVEIDNLDLILKASECTEVGTMIDQLTDRHERLKSELIESCSHPRTIIGNLKIQKVKRLGNFDYPKFLKDHKMEIPESYRKESSEAWRIIQNR